MDSGGDFELGQELPRLNDSKHGGARMGRSGRNVVNWRFDIGLCAAATLATGFSEIPPMVLLRRRSSRAGYLKYESVFISC